MARVDRPASGLVPDVAGLNQQLLLMTLAEGPECLGSLGAHQYLEPLQPRGRTAAGVGRVRRHTQAVAAFTDKAVGADE